MIVVMQMATFAYSLFTINHSLYHPFKQFQFSFERRIFNTRVKPCWRFHHCFFMAECFKRIFAMIIPGAAETAAAKWQMMIGEMPACIVHASATKGNTVEPFIFFCMARCENIKCQRIRVLLNYPHRLLFCFE